MAEKRRSFVWYARGVVFTLVALGVTACIPLGPPNAVNVVLKKDNLELSPKSVAIPDFYVPEHGAGFGGSFADTLQAILLEKSVFQKISRDLPVVWTHPGETLEARYAGLVRSAAQRGLDYVLIGSVDEIFYGGLEDTRLAITLRLFDSQTGAVLFMAAHKLVSKAKDSSYPLDTKLTSQADSPLLLAEKVLRPIITRLR